jgi:aminoglycoside phosphotransferase (APT) family kinase protein
LSREAPDTLVSGVALSAAGVEVRQFAHGQSNPTYHVSGPNVLKRPLVLRKKPPGKLLPSAHRVEREQQVLAALSRASACPVPRPVAVCEDASVLGTPFYLMEFAQVRSWLHDA